jgi:hypothetical protein
VIGLSGDSTGRLAGNPDADEPPALFSAAAVVVFASAAAVVVFASAAAVVAVDAAVVVVPPVPPPHAAMPKTNRLHNTSEMTFFIKNLLSILLPPDLIISLTS